MVNMSKITWSIKMDVSFHKTEILAHYITEWGNTMVIEPLAHRWKPMHFAVLRSMGTITAYHQWCRRREWTIEKRNIYIWKSLLPWTSNCIGFPSINRQEGFREPIRVGMPWWSDMRPGPPRIVKSPNLYASVLSLTFVEKRNRVKKRWKCASFRT